LTGAEVERLAPVVAAMAAPQSDPAPDPQSRQQLTQSI
jgi:hypothetical protein